MNITGQLTLKIPVPFILFTGHINCSHALTQAPTNCQDLIHLCTNCLAILMTQLLFLLNIKPHPRCQCNTANCIIFRSLYGYCNIKSIHNELHPQTFFQMLYAGVAIMNLWLLSILTIPGLSISTKVIG